MDAIFLECLVFHNVSEKIKMGWSHSPPNTEGKIVFYAASGWAFKLHIPGIKPVRYLSRAQQSLLVPRAPEHQEWAEAQEG